MELYYSNIEKTKLLHIVIRGDDDFQPGRKDLIAPDNFIQCAALHFDAGKTFRPHKHKWKSNWPEDDCCPTTIAQESWIVLRGSVRCIFYDIDNTILASPVLLAGDASFTLFGGHNYEILEDGSKILEYKTGPYEGQENDKEFI